MTVLLATTTRQEHSLPDAVVRRSGYGGICHPGPWPDQLLPCHVRRLGASLCIDAKFTVIVYAI